MEIPWQMLSEATLNGVIKDFIFREGTDYGPREYSLEEKIEQVKKQLEKGTAKITFDESTETCTLVPGERVTS